MNSLAFDTAQIAAYRKALDLMAQNSSSSPNAAREKRSNALPPPPPAKVAEALNIQSLTVEWLAGDGSDRCYYRVTSPDLVEITAGTSAMPSKSLVLMQLSDSDAQALKDDGYDWIKIADILSKHGIFVPRVVATLPEHAALIIEDYGNEMLEGRIYALAEDGEIGPIRSNYRECAEIIAKFLAIAPSPKATWCRRSFDVDRFVWELNFFLEKYGRKVAGLELSTAERGAFESEARALSQTLASNSKYFVHRDFHSRNIMVKDGRLAVIDFQDARLGPAAYDLVSLCFDSYVPFGPGVRQQLMDDALAVLKERAGDAIHAEILELWKPTLLQRQLKAIGSFGYLTRDKQRGDYLRYVDPALRTLEEHDVVDQRWPFLSSVLIKRLRAHLDESSHVPHR